MNNQSSPNPEEQASREAEEDHGLITWFEIPALNFQRAVEFYNQVFDIQMETSEVNTYSMAFFPHDTGAGGAVVSGEGSLPSEHGTLIYLNAGPHLDTMLSRIEHAGGKVILGKTLISEKSGHFAVFMDTEGNKLALHSKHSHEKPN